MRVLIFEPEFGGHRLSGVRVLIDALSTLDQASISKLCIATTKPAPKSDEFRVQLGDVCEQFDIEYVDDFGLHTRNFLKIAYKKARSLFKLANSGEWDQIYVPYGDGLLQVISVLNILPWYSIPKNVHIEAILMRCTLGYESGSFIQRLVQKTAIRFSPFDRIHLIDPVSYLAICKKHSRLLKKVVLLPDPISETPEMEKSASREALLLPVEGRCVGLVGRIDARKGADVLLESFLNANLNDNDFLLLAGKHSEELANRVCSLSSANVRSIDRYLTEEEMFQAIAAMDVVATPYRKDFIGSVSIVLRAASAGRYCLGSNGPWMSYVIQKFKLGAICDVSNSNVLSENIASALGNSDKYGSTVESMALVEYGKIQNIRKCWIDGISNRLSNEHKSESKLSWPDSSQSAL